MWVRVWFKGTPALPRVCYGSVSRVDLGAPERWDTEPMLTNMKNRPLRILQHQANAIALFVFLQGGFFFGFVGLLIGVPIAAGLKLLVVRGLARYKTSDFYRGGAVTCGT